VKEMEKEAGGCMSWHNLICTLAHPFKSASIHSAIHCAHCIKRIKIRHTNELENKLAWAVCMGINIATGDLSLYGFKLKKFQE